MSIREALEVVPQQTTLSRMTDWTTTVAVLMFVSGGASLIIETIFFRLLSYTFGNTAIAASTVLAVFMGGLAIGSATIGKWCSKRPQSLRLYGFLELLVAIYCVLVPILMEMSTQAYVASARALGYGQTVLPLQVAFAGLTIAPPAILMGGTLPVIVSFLNSTNARSETAIPKVYASNTLGAAFGTLAAAYMLIPTFGIGGTLKFACAMDVLLFAVVVLIAPKPMADQILVAKDSQPAEFNIPRAVYLTLAFISGAIALGYEVVWNHTLSFLVGNTVYSFALMLFSMLVGLALGSRIVATKLANRKVWLWALVLSQFLTGAVVLLSLPLWQFVPGLFNLGFVGIHASVFGTVLFIVLARLLWVIWNRRTAPVRSSWIGNNEDLLLVFTFFVIVFLVLRYFGTPQLSFVAGDLLRFFCAFGLLIVPSTLLGISFPLLLDLSAGRSDQAAEVGLVYGLNTIGAVVGSLLAGFFILPQLGSFASLRALALASMLSTVGLALLPRMALRARAGLISGVVACAGLLFFVIPGWSGNRINSGTYAYFAESEWSGGRVLSMNEDLQSGMTTVIQYGEKRVLLSNAKYQGDNREGIGDQTRFALVPMLFAKNTGRALVIGLGTGNTLRTVSHFPFKAIDVVDISPGVVEAARNWFRDVNGGVLDEDPRVTLTIADARNFLLLSDQKYDLVTIEVSSLWISGQGDLYNKEFYDLVRAHLTPTGVLQQWVALHHLRQNELFLVLNTAAESFPHTAFFLGSNHGLLIAGLPSFTCEYQKIEEFNRLPGLKKDFAALDIQNLWAVLREMKLDDQGVRLVLDKLASDYRIPRNRISTDYFPRLEYGAPKGLLVPDDMFGRNKALLDAFAKENPFDLVRGTPPGAKPADFLLPASTLLE
jgi:spermidine synthase